MKPALLILVCSACFASHLRADEATDLLSQAIVNPNSSQVSDAAMEQAEQAKQRLISLPPRDVVPAILDAINRQDAVASDRRVFGNALVRLLNDLAEKADRQEFDNALVEGWSRATTASAKFVLLIRYDHRRIASGEPMARAVYEDQSADPNLRKRAATALLHLNPKQYHERLLWELDARPEWGSDLLYLLLEPGPEPIDPVVVTIAMHRIEATAQTSKPPMDLIVYVGEYTREHFGIADAMRRGANALEGLSSRADQQRAQVKLALDWWQKNKQRFEPEYQKRKAATRPAEK